MLRTVCRGIATALAPALRSVHTLPKLDYPIERGIAPAISAETLDFHYNKHHATYVNNLNRLTAATSYDDASLEDIIRSTVGDPSDAAIFNNAAQHYNHSFFWKCMIPHGTDMPASLQTKLVEEFGSVDAFKEKFTASALGLFGSGWTWLTASKDNKLTIVNTSNAGLPLTSGARPLLTCDVWEHAYYLDYQNKRAEFVKNWWEVVNWEAVNQRLIGKK